MAGHLQARLLGTALGCAMPVVASSPAAPPPAELLTRQLGHADFAIRQYASSRLLRLGSAALPAVEAAAACEDPEVRIRAAALLPHLRRLRFEQRIDRFLRAGLGGPEATAYDLPGWQGFASLLKEDAPSRRVYAAAFCADPLLLETAFKGRGVEPLAPPASLSGLLEARLKGLGRVAHTPGADGEPAALFPQALAVLYVAAARPEAVSERSAHLLVRVAKAGVVPVAAAGGDTVSAAAQGVLGHWIAMSPAEGLHVAGEMLRIADNLDLKQGASLAVSIALGERSAGATPAQTRADALLTLGRLGGRKHADRLRPLLSDTSVCISQDGRTGNSAELIDVQVRDVALAVMAHLRGRPPETVGLRHARRHEQRLFVLHSLGFASEDARVAAIHAWREEAVNESGSLWTAARGVNAKRR